jgi:ABC-type phosphate transport system ATPase subunit
MIKLKNILKEEVDKTELKKQVKIAIDALNTFSKEINEFVNIFVRYHKL